MRNKGSKGNIFSIPDFSFDIWNQINGLRALSTTGPGRKTIHSLHRKVYRNRHHTPHQGEQECARRRRQMETKAKRDAERREKDERALENYNRWRRNMEDKANVAP